MLPGCMVREVAQIAPKCSSFSHSDQESPMSVARRIALRYLSSLRHEGRFVSFIAGVSVLGIALGVAALITVLSVMNGFQAEIQERMLSMTPHVRLIAPEGHAPQAVSTWSQRLANLPTVAASTPVSEHQGMLLKEQQVQGVILQGIEPESFASVLPLEQNIVHGSFHALVPGGFGVVIGAPLAHQLGVTLGDRLMFVTPELSSSVLGFKPRMRQVTVVGLFHSGYVYDQGHVFMALDDAAALYSQRDRINAVHLRLNNPWQAARMAQSWNQERQHRLQQGQDLAEEAWAVDWGTQHAAYFKAVRMEKTMMAMVLCLIVAVASFNLISTLVMLVQEKETELAIVSAMGGSPNTLCALVAWQGFWVISVGVAVGAVLGCGLAYAITDIANAVEHLLGVQWFASEVYFVDFLPSQLHLSDVVGTVGITCVMGALATWYPARRAMRLMPAEVLRYA